MATARSGPASSGSEAWTTEPSIRAGGSVHRRIVRPLLLTLVALLLGAVAPVTAYAGGAGSLDRSFAGDGTLTASVGRWSSAQAVAIQPDGKIVVAGYASGPDTP